MLFIFFKASENPSYDHMLLLLNEGIVCWMLGFVKSSYKQLNSAKDNLGM